ncbi:MAG: hypothetical protein RL513_998 [Pseudomonadota bacterium]
MAEADIQIQGHVLHAGGHVAVFDARGDIADATGSAQGFFCGGVRCLSRLALTIGGAKPLWIGDSLKESHTLLVIQLANSAVELAGRPAPALGELHLLRATFLWQGACHVHLRIRHHGREPVRVDLALGLDADFAGLAGGLAGEGGNHRVQRQPAECLGGELRLAARGPGGRQARTRITLRPAPGHLTPGEARWAVQLPPQGEFHLYAEVRAQVREGGDAAASLPPPQDYDAAYRAAAQARGAWRDARADVEVSDACIQRWLSASLADVWQLQDAAAWYETFLAARLTLWLDPSLGRAALHRWATAPASGPLSPPLLMAPLAIALAGAWHRRNGDLQALRVVWPSLRAALGRIGEALDARGFLAGAYPDSRRPFGLLHADGCTAGEPLVWCEIQAQVVEAWQHAADLAHALEESALATRLRAQAREGRQRLLEAFWIEDLSCFAPALDAQGQVVRAVSARAACVLEAGLATPVQAGRMAQRLLEPDVDTGFGLRSLASGQAGFNPLALDRGAVWPQDCARAALGLARYGHTAAAVHLFDAMADAAGALRLQRMPQAFAGFTRREGEGPARLPGACWPHAGAAAAAPGLLQACLGLDIDALHRGVTLRAPCLPRGVDWLRLQDLRVGPVRLDLRLERAAGSVGVQLTRQEGEGEVQVCVEAAALRSGT